MKKLVLITIFLGIELLANSISKEDLGKALFFDVNLSKNRTQSCATCHNPEAAFIDDRDNGVSKMASLGDDLKSLGATFINLFCLSLLTASANLLARAISILEATTPYWFCLYL